MSFEFLSDSPQSTEELGCAIGTGAEPGLVVTLRGDLGAGKTLMTKGIARGLGVPHSRYVTSPTFTIHKSYKGRLALDHMDFYRLGDEGELEDLGFDEVLGANGVSVIEWPDRFFSYLGTDRLDIAIEVLEGDNRRLTFDWSGTVASKIGKSLIDQFNLREA